jgi:hypothetical protein
MKSKKEPYNEENLISDFFKEMEQKEDILKQPLNSLTRLQLQNVEESELTKRVKKHYEGFTLIEFLNHTSK